MKKKKVKYTFILKSVKVENIDKIYGINLISNISDNNTLNLENVTKVTDLSNDIKTFSYLDESKKEHKCIITMIDYIKNNKLMFDLNNNINCFWCRHNFFTYPIGCPIQYVSTQLTKSYYSEITKDKYMIRENISVNKKKDVEDLLTKGILTDKKIHIQDKNYYLTDGFFCSFNCCLGFIEDNAHIPLYSESKVLLSRIFYSLFITDKKIIPAPSWRLLENFGGHLTIDEFRKSYNKVEYLPLDNIITDLARFKPTGFLFEQKVKI